MRRFGTSRWWALLSSLVIATMLVTACAGPGNGNNGNVVPTEVPGEAPGDEPVAPEPTEDTGEGALEETPEGEAEGEVEETPEGEGEGEVEETPEGEGEGQGAAEDLDGAAAPLNPDVSGNVEFWHFWGSPVRRSAIRRAIATCEEKLPNIQVEEVFKPWGDIWTANTAAVAAGSGMPDIIVEDRPQLPQRATDNVVMSLQPMIDESGMDPEQFWEFAWQEATFEDEVYGIPFETDVRVLYWNKQAFADAGLDPETPPETWDDLMEYADALDIQNEDGSYERIGIFPLWNAGADMWALTNGWEPVVDGMPNVDDPAFVETVEWIEQWIERYGGWQNLQNYQAQYSAPPNDLFMSGAVAMLVDIGGYHSILSFYRPRYETADGESVNMEWGISFIPYREEKADWSGGFSLSIPRGAENQEPAWEMIKCLTGPEAQLSWARDTYAIPGNREAAYSNVMMSDPYWEAIIENMEYSQGTTYVPEYPNWTEQLWPQLEEIWIGNVEAEPGLQEVQSAVEAQIGE